MLEQLQQAAPNIVFSAILFLVLWNLVGVRCFKPFFEMLEQREAKTVGDERRAKEIKETTVRVEHEIELELHNARVAGVKEREERLQVAKSKAQEITTEASESAQQELAAGRAEIEQLKNKARRDLEQEASGLAKNLVSQILQSESQSTTIH